MAILVMPVLGLALTGPVSAATTSSQSRATPAQSDQPDQCIQGNGGCLLFNLDDDHDLGINGLTHGQRLFGEAYPNADYYSFVQKDGSWGWMVSNQTGLCWNQAHGAVYLDSCVAPDANEYFDFVADGNYWLIHNYAEGNTLNVAATTSNSGWLYFTSGANDTSLWWDAG
jgi:hypothetical protein